MKCMIKVSRPVKIYSVKVYWVKVCCGGMLKASRSVNIHWVKVHHEVVWLIIMRYIMYLSRFVPEAYNGVRWVWRWWAWVVCEAGRRTRYITCFFSSPLRDPVFDIWVF